MVILNPTTTPNTSEYARADYRDTFLDFEHLRNLAHARRGEYCNAKPYPNIVLDNFLEEQVFERVLASFPRLDDCDRFQDFSANMDNGKQAQVGKIHLSDIRFMGPAIRQLIFELNSGPFLTVLQRLTGIKPLLSDPQLQGGGIHMTRRGGILRVHADFNKHQVYDLDRRLNLLLYFNPGWQEEYGGQLELWPSDMSRCARRITPIANRCVLFSTTSDSYHGHPQPLNCPEGEARKSLALYYYTVGRPKQEERPSHGTLWQELPEERATQRL